MLYHERRARRQGYDVVIGVDEAGRGPLAGPLVVAAACLRTHRFSARIDDSKKLTPPQRERAFLELGGKAFFDVAWASAEAIETLGIAGAAAFGVDAAVARLIARLAKENADHRGVQLLLDGALSTRMPYPAKVIIGGDGKSLSIAAASIVAKVVRDRLMRIYDRVYPGYAFAAHKGYGTAVHRRRLARHGLCPIHRVSFCKGWVKHG
ncbi:MAG: ribonuclease HII [Deltaproteobacteria bacterium]